MLQYEFIKKALGQELKAQRKALRVSQLELSLQLETVSSVIYAYEKGSTLSLKLFIEACISMNINPGALLNAVLRQYCDKVEGLVRKSDLTDQELLYSVLRSYVSLPLDEDNELEAGPNSDPKQPLIRLMRAPVEFVAIRRKNEPVRYLPVSGVSSSKNTNEHADFVHKLMTALHREEGNNQGISNFKLPREYFIEFYHTQDQRVADVLARRKKSAPARSSSRRKK